MDRIIFGDNQFFGINHMSEDKAQALSERFHDLKAITHVIDIAYDCGIRGFMLNANERASAICDYLRKNSSRFPSMKMYPSIPYPHKYANLVNEKGIFNAVADVLLTDSTAKDVLGMFLKGGITLFDRDVIKVMQMLVDVEMKMFSGLDVKIVFLQNVVTDLLLGIGAKDLFRAYDDYIRKRYGCEPGFISMNMPKLKKQLLVWGIKDPIICSSINKQGYFMNPDVASYEKVLAEEDFRPIAMSILASGSIAPREAVEYVCRQPHIMSIVFGASSRRNIEETIALISRYSLNRS